MAYNAKKSCSSLSLSLWSKVFTFPFWVTSLLVTIGLLCVYFSAWGTTWGEFNFSSSSISYYRIQVESLLGGHFSLSSRIDAIRFDLAWYDGGVQQIWGLGVPLWMLPFEGVSRIFGYYCSDIVPLLVALGLLVFYTLQTSHLLLRKKQPYPVAFLFSGIVFFLPSLWIFFWGPKSIYGVACLYALIFCLILLVATIRYVIARRNFDFFLACFLAGFVANVRPTYGVYGVAAACICLWHSLYPWRSRRKIGDLKKTFIGCALSLGGFLFLAWSNWLRFGNPFEFGHNLSFSANTIVYLTRFGNPCDEASFWTLARELFFWLFTIPYWTWLEAPIPRWRDIYQPTFGLTYLALLILCGVLLVRFVAMCKRAGRLRPHSSGNNLSLQPAGQTPSWKYVLVNSLVFWFAISFVPLSLFYLKFATLSTRYIHDFAPAFLAATFCLLFCSGGTGRWKKCCYGGLYAFICWKLIYLITFPASNDTWARLPRGTGELAPLEGRILSDYQGIYTPENHPWFSGIMGNGMEWNRETGLVGAMAILMVDRPQFLELTLGPEAEDFPEVYRAKINTIELPIIGITPTKYGTNTAKRVRFSIPESILRQNGNQLISLCFTPSFHGRDMKRTRPLYQVRWK